MKQSLFTRISEIAGQLQAEGKTPNLALIRGRLDLPASQAELFSTYQQWRNQGAPLSQPGLSQTTSAKAEPEAAEPTSAVDLAELQASLTRIETKLDLLLQKLAERA